MSLSTPILTFLSAQTQELQRLVRRGKKHGVAPRDRRRHENSSTVKCPGPPS